MDALISTAGLGYFAAVTAVLVAALIAKAGAPRSPKEEPERRGAVMATIAFAAALTPSILMFYAYAITREAPSEVRIALMALPVIAGFLGSFLGALIGLVTREARIMFRMASIVAGFAALIVALGVTLPRIDRAWALEQTAKFVNAAEAFAESVTQLPRPVS